MTDTKEDAKEDAKEDNLRNTGRRKVYSKMVKFDLTDCFTGVADRSGPSLPMP